MLGWCPKPESARANSADSITPNFSDFDQFASDDLKLIDPVLESDLTSEKFRLGLIGMSTGNGHPYSWSAICNGYDQGSWKTVAFLLFQDIPKSAYIQMTLFMRPRLHTFDSR